MHARFASPENALYCHEFPLFALTVISEHHMNFQIPSVPNTGTFWTISPAGGRPATSTGRLTTQRTAGQEMAGRPFSLGWLAMFSVADILTAANCSHAHAVRVGAVWKKNRNRRIDKSVTRICHFSYQKPAVQLTNNNEFALAVRFGAVLAVSAVSAIPRPPPSRQPLPHPPLSLQSSPPRNRSRRNPLCLFATDAWQDTVNARYDFITWCWCMRIVSLGKLDVIGIDEAQFFGDLYDFCCKVADHDGKTVIVAGLDGDYLRAADLTLVPSAALAKELEAARVTAGNKIRLWNKGVDSESFHLKYRAQEMRIRLSNGEPERPLIVHVGRLGVEKSLDLLKSVMDQIPEAQIAFIGDGPYREDLEKLFSGMPAVFTGMLGGVASLLGKRSMSFSGIEVCDHETNGVEDDLSDDGSQAGEKKRRLNLEQVKTLEKNFELGNKLESERKMQLARALGLQPRQIAIWFQNMRARWKTKQLEKDYDVLKRQFDAIKADNDALQSQNQKTSS
ncbi:hypothetical protein HYC85_032070 [Camellia sinensis]|uniref:Homeobox-leucine zipper protein n=1 Tax=Camellia sinensis TaxID=4442 RepID=A0A7J7FSY0_CAMSI|nr:hypothetical protein HYC85_032070 [Camellia sinensis]